MLIVFSHMTCSAPARVRRELEVRLHAYACRNCLAHPQPALFSIKTTCCLTNPALSPIVTQRLLESDCTFYKTMQPPKSSTPPMPHLHEYHRSRTSQFGSMTRTTSRRDPAEKKSVCLLCLLLRLLVSSASCPFRLSHFRGIVKDGVCSELAMRRCIGTN